MSRRIAVFAVALLASFLFVGFAAADSGLAGKWTWQWTTRGIKKKTVTLTADLKVGDGKVTGTVATASGKKYDVKGGTATADAIEFNWEDKDGIPYKHQGKLDGNKLVGKTVWGLGEYPMNRPWEATRVK
jgi:hypothetical protein